MSMKYEACVYVCASKFSYLALNVLCYFCVYLSPNAICRFHLHFVLYYSDDIHPYLISCTHMFGGSCDEMKAVPHGPALCYLLLCSVHIRHAFTI